MYLVKYVTTMNNSVELFLQQGSFRSNLSRARYIGSDVLHVTLVNYRCEKLERIFHMWCFRSNVSQLCGELSQFFHSFTAVKYWIEFLTSDIYGRIFYMWHILVKYRCEKFGRIFSHVMYSAEYVMTLTNLVKLFTSVKYSIIFLMFDIFSRNFTFAIFDKCRCEKFGQIFHMWCFLSSMSQLIWIRSIFHICAVYHWISHVWYNRSNILHVALSANIGVRYSVGFFTSDEFCRICHNCDE